MKRVEGWENGGGFSQDNSYADLSGTLGIYVIARADGEDGYKYEDGDNRILYVGSGDIGIRLTKHSTEDPDNDVIAEELDSSILLEFRYMQVGEAEDHERQHLEGDLIEAFREEYGLADNGRSPHANIQQPAESSEEVALEDFAYGIIDFYDETDDEDDDEDD